MFDAIVVAGGSARRLGGVDKPAVEVRGTALLEYALIAVTGAQRVLVVGPQRHVTDAAMRARVRWCREDPPGGGPVAAVAAALPGTDAAVVVVLAADMPGIAPAVPVLVQAVRQPADESVPIGGATLEVAVLVDTTGQRTLLAAAWQRAALLEAVRRIGDPQGAPMRALYRGARVVEIADPAGWATDCNTWDDVARARRQDRTDPSPA